MLTRGLQPCSLGDFMDYLTYIQHNAENLQFYLWLQDYRKRFAQKKAQEQALSPEWKHEPFLSPGAPGRAPGGSLAKQAGPVPHGAQNTNIEEESPNAPATGALSADVPASATSGIAGDALPPTGLARAKELNNRILPSLASI